MALRRSFSSEIRFAIVVVERRIEKTKPFFLNALPDTWQCRRAWVNMSALAILLEHYVPVLTVALNSPCCSRNGAPARPGFFWHMTYVFRMGDIGQQCEEFKSPPTRASDVATPEVCRSRFCDRSEWRSWRLCP